MVQQGHAAPVRAADPAIQRQRLEDDETQPQIASGVVQRADEFDELQNARPNPLAVRPGAPSARPRLEQREPANEERAAEAAEMAPEKSELARYVEDNAAKFFPMPIDDGVEKALPRPVPESVSAPVLELRKKILIRRIIAEMGDNPSMEAIRARESQWVSFASKGVEPVTHQWIGKMMCQHAAKAYKGNPTEIVLPDGTNHYVIKDGSRWIDPTWKQFFEAYRTVGMDPIFIGDADDFLRLGLPPGSTQKYFDFVKPRKATTGPAADPRKLTATEMLNEFTDLEVEEITAQALAERLQKAPLPPTADEILSLQKTAQKENRFVCLQDNVFLQVSYAKASQGLYAVRLYQRAAANASQTPANPAGHNSNN